jgi:hypothetical protein
MSEDVMLDAAQDIAEIVKGLADGTVSTEEADRFVQQLERKKQTHLVEPKKVLSPEQLKKEREEKQRKGQEGSGKGELYKYYCPKCRVEFEIEVEKCGRCNGSVMSKEQRHQYLKDKVEELRTQKENRKVFFLLVESGSLCFFVTLFCLLVETTSAF